MGANMSQYAKLDQLIVDTIRVPDSRPDMRLELSMFAEAHDVHIATILRTRLEALRNDGSIVYDKKIDAWFVSELNGR